MKRSGCPFLLPSFLPLFLISMLMFMSNRGLDRYLLCLAHKYGYGNWDLVKAAIRRSDRYAVYCCMSLNCCISVPIGSI